MSAIEKLVKAEALVADLENQIAEGLAGMDQAEARVAELEGAGAAFIDSWSGGDVQKAPMYAAVVAMEQALSGDGSAYADVVRAARMPGRTFQHVSSYGTSHEAGIRFNDKADAEAFRRALIKMEGTTP